MDSPAYLNEIGRHFKPHLLAIAVVATLALAAPWSVAGADPGSCSTQLNRVEAALTGGRKLDAAQMTMLQGCFRSQPAAMADSIEQAQAGSATTNTAAAAATVVASYKDAILCLDFNSDGTISSPTPGLTTVAWGGYLGTPGSFTLFAYGGNLQYIDAVVPYVAVGLSIGSVSLEAYLIFGYVPFYIPLGFQVPSCQT